LSEDLKPGEGEAFRWRIIGQAHNDIIQKLLEYLKKNPESTKTNIITNIKKIKNKFDSYLSYLIENKLIIKVKKGRWDYFSIAGELPKATEIELPRVEKKIVYELNEELWININNKIRNEIANFLGPYIKKVDELWNNYKKIDSSKINFDNFRNELKNIYNILNRQNLYGGLVPIPNIKNELKRRKILISNELIDNYLEQLEKNNTINLVVASDPSRLKDKELGIKNLKRGLLYFIKWK